MSFIYVCCTDIKISNFERNYERKQAVIQKVSECHMTFWNIYFNIEKSIPEELCIKSVDFWIT